MVELAQRVLIYIVRFCARAKEEEEEGSGCFWKTVERSGNVFGLSLRQILERAEILRLLSFHTRYVYMSVGCWAMDHGRVTYLFIVQDCSWARYRSNDVLSCG